MTTLATIRQAMTAFLAEAGIEALSAWPKEVWKGRKTPVAVVQAICSKRHSRRKFIPI